MTALSYDSITVPTDDDAVDVPTWRAYAHGLAMATRLVGIDTETRAQVVSDLGSLVREIGARRPRLRIVSAYLDEITAALLAAPSPPDSVLDLLASRPTTDPDGPRRFPDSRFSGGT
ncbi:hypothetical protein HMPREF0063_10131 [Aeromicrobium marinum DSM 15272]|uniref:Uncharacterized protein n=1 Tax=Aeromicrobium marinum DSM 15272 TaxID=585531 RepID=E2S7X4_9ACTN|nr:hypothetical protein [Aeromicrobium marinum]EFQ84790.1 hypothetical protein HMPREF0063_10131 [Aeromicrobium marinum DSM 15272]